MVFIVLRPGFNPFGGEVEALTDFSGIKSGSMLKTIISRMAKLFGRQGDQPREGLLGLFQSAGV